MRFFYSALPCFLRLMSYLGIKFFNVWRTEETEHWIRSGSPNIISGGYLIWGLILGSECERLGNTKLLELRNLYRTLILIFLTLLLALLVLS